jgi:hypothetical protein
MLQYFKTNDKAYRFEEARVQVPVLHSKWKTGSKAPPSIKHVEDPEEDATTVALRTCGERRDICLMAMEAKLEAHANSQPMQPPSHDVVVSVEIEQ